MSKRARSDEDPSGAPDNDAGRGGDGESDEEDDDYDPDADADEAAELAEDLAESNAAQTNAASEATVPAPPRLLLGHSFMAALGTSQGVIFILTLQPCLLLAVMGERNSGDDSGAAR